MKDNYSWLDVAKYIYEATRVEAEWSKRPIVPELWENRDDKFRKQFVDIIAKYMSMDKLPTPAEAHESWNQSYYKMGWKYGEVRDVEAKTHPDLVPFDELSQPERDKDAIFLAFVWLATQLQSQIEIEKLRASLEVPSSTENPTTKLQIQEKVIDELEQLYTNLVAKEVRKATKLIPSDSCDCMICRQLKQLELGED